MHADGGGKFGAAAPAWWSSSRVEAGEQIEVDVDGGVVAIAPALLPSLLGKLEAWVDPEIVVTSR